MPDKYYLIVDQNDDDKPYVNLYKGSNVADAMATWSKAISEGADYVMFEALKERP